MKLYTEEDLEIIVVGNRTLAEGRGANWVWRVGIAAELRVLPDKMWNHPYKLVLPFPFTLEEFRDFCNWHPTFKLEAIEFPFTKDDEILDEDALKELAMRGEDAAELVRLLLEPLESEQVTVFPSGLTTTEIGTAFADLPFKYENWARRLSSANWLQGARISAGARGGESAKWCPVRVAQASYKQAKNFDKPKRLKALNNRFKTQTKLAPWLDEWNDFYATFNNTD